MHYEKFTDRLKNLCASLGFSTLWTRDGEDEPDGHVPEISWRWTEKEEAVIFLSCRVPYNPNWGGYCGHPQLVQAQGNEEECSPAAFIAPYLQQYRFAREHVFLVMNGRGDHFITLPTSLLDRSGDCGRLKLIIELAKVAQPDKSGNIIPVETFGPMRSFALSDTLRQDLEVRNFAWKPQGTIQIGRYLGSDLFTFIEVGDMTDREGLFEATLLPHLREIVAHQTPNLRAAEIHLSQIFTRTVAALHAEYNRNNVLCLAGLDIDMSTLMGHREHCFVPWKAYLARRGEALFLEQDDLFVRLIQTSK